MGKFLMGSHGLFWSSWTGANGIYWALCKAYRLFVCGFRAISKPMGPKCTSLGENEYRVDAMGIPSDQSDYCSSALGLQYTTIMVSTKDYRMIVY